MTRIVNYIILAHKNPHQLKRLISKLAVEGAHCYLHIDQKCKIREWIALIPESKYVSYIKQREDCRWGDISIVDAIVECFKEITADRQSGHCVLLSGQDYPLKSGEEIRDFLASHPENNFINIYSIPDSKKKSEGGGRERLISYTFDCRNPKDNRMKAKIQPLSLKPKTILGFFRIIRYRRDVLPFACKAWQKRRPYPKGLVTCFNEMWMVLNIHTVRYLLETWEKHPEYRNYYQYTHVPDETAFGAILMANEKIRNTIQPMLHYVSWEEGAGGSPKTLEMEDVRWLMEEGRRKREEGRELMFARKFEEDSPVLDYIDDEIEAGR